MSACRCCIPACPPQYCCCRPLWICLSLKTWPLGRCTCCPAKSGREQACQSRDYDGKAKGSPLAFGDRVLPANCGETGKRKIADRWESTVYEIVSVKPAINVYCIRDYSGLRGWIESVFVLLNTSSSPLLLAQIPSPRPSVESQLAPSCDQEVIF